MHHSKKTFLSAIGVAGLMAGLMTGLITGAALAGPAADKAFVDGVNACVNFGSDGWMVTDRLEEKGWQARDDAYYDTVVLYAPGDAVWVVPPAEDSGFPATCATISGSVSRDYGLAALRAVLKATQVPFEEGTLGGCPFFKTSYGQEIRALSDGQDDFCTDPGSARVVSVFTVNPVGNQ